MAKKKKYDYIKIAMRICKEDQVVADWLNMLIRTKQNKSKWAAAILIAYDRHEIPDLGCVTTHTQTPYSSIKDVQSNKAKTSQLTGDPIPEIIQTPMFGYGSAQNSAQGKEKKAKNQPITHVSIGKVVLFEICDKSAVTIAKRLIKNGNKMSSLLKYMIKTCVTIGPEEQPPSESNRTRYLTQNKYTPLENNHSPTQNAQKAVAQTSKASIPMKTAEESDPSEANLQSSQVTVPEFRNPLLDLIM